MQNALIVEQIDTKPNLMTLVAQALVPLRVKTAQDLVRRFFEGRAPTTLEAYSRDLKDFVMFLRATVGHPLTMDEAAAILLADGDMSQANAVADAYRSHLMEKKYAPNTINRRLTAIRSLVQVAKRYGMVEWELTVDNVKSEAYRETTGFGLDGLKKQIKTAKKRDDEKGVRDYAILRLNADMAFRRSTIEWLNVGDVELNEEGDGGFLRYRVKGKSAKEQKRKELPEPTARALARWMEVRKEMDMPADATAPLFVNFDHAGKQTEDGRLTGHSINRIIKAISKQAGIPNNSSHKNRHASITAVLDATDGDVVAGMDHADHGDIRTTQRYNDNRGKKGSKAAKLVASLIED